MKVGILDKNQSLQILCGKGITRMLRLKKSLILQCSIVEFGNFYLLDFFLILFKFSLWLFRLELPLLAHLWFFEARKFISFFFILFLYALKCSALSLAVQKCNALRIVQWSRQTLQSLWPIPSIVSLHLTIIFPFSLSPIASTINRSKECCRLSVFSPNILPFISTSSFDFTIHQYLPLPTNTPYFAFALNPWPTVSQTISAPLLSPISNLTYKKLSLRPHDLSVSKYLSHFVTHMQSRICKTWIILSYRLRQWSNILGKVYVRALCPAPYVPNRCANVTRRFPNSGHGLIATRSLLLSLYLIPLFFALALLIPW